MADEVVIDSDTFHERLTSLITAWKQDKRNGDSIFQAATSLAIISGKSTDEQNIKSRAIQSWLLGYEFPTTLFVFTTDFAYILTTKKKASLLEGLKNGRTPVEIIVRGKDADDNAKQLDRLVEFIKQSGNKVGVLSKESSDAPMVVEWKAALSEANKHVTEVDIAPAISSVLAVKDEKELRLVRDAARASSGVMAQYFVDYMSGLIDNDKKITHAQMSDKIAAKIDDTKFFKEVKVSKQFEQEQLDWSLSPIVQSGGNYNLKLSAEPDSNNLHPGVIIATFGLKYQNYSSMISRTYLVDPNKSQEAAYKTLLAVHNATIKNAKDGVPAKDVYSKALAIVKSQQPELEKHFVTNVGAGIGLEPRDTSLMLNAKNATVLRDGMTLSIMTGFNAITNPKPQDSKSKTYSLAVCDTVRVGQSEGLVFTKDAPTDPESTVWFFNDEEEDKKEEKKSSKPKKDSRIGAVAQTNIRNSRLREGRAVNQKDETDAVRAAHQKELHEKKQREGLETYGKGTGKLNGAEQKKFKRFESYKQPNQLPSKVKDMMVIIDQKSSSVLLPIMGRPVPFHINTIKNASATKDPGGSMTQLRINFLTPGQGIGKRDEPFEDISAHFIRSMTFRSESEDRMNNTADQITEMKKEAQRKVQERKEMEDVVEQGRLVEIKSRRPIHMDQIYLRPALENKRVSGLVEIHQNGIRYVHMSGAKHDVLFSNVKHLFFQPSKSEMIVIIHLHLHNPIIIGKKKTRDVQFYREASEMLFDDTTNRKRRHRYGDEEELEAEQEEKRRRAALDKEFKNFAEKIADAGRDENLQVDIPIRDLSFNGVPSRSSVTVSPTFDCLVQLTEPPFLVITLSEIEIVHLERVQFGLKQFDMVVVFKDFQRTPAHINTIPVESLDAVKDWLDGVDIAYSEGPLNLNWGSIMQHLISDPHEFYAEGGWKFLATESDSEGGEDESDEESAFEAESDAFDSASSEEDESEFDDAASAEASEAASSDDEEADDWDDMEKKAAKKDRDGGLSEDEGESKKKRR